MLFVAIRLPLLILPGLLSTLLAIDGCAAQRLPNGITTAMAPKEGKAPSPSYLHGLNQAVWDDSGIVRRRSLRTLAGLGPSSWDLKVLLAPLPELGDNDASDAIINMLTALDPASVEHPERMTELLLSSWKTTDLRQIQGLVYGLGLLFEMGFSVSSQDEAVKAALLQALHAPEPGLRQLAAEAFGRFRVPSTYSRYGSPIDLEVGRTLVALTEDGDPKVRRASLVAFDWWWGTGAEAAAAIVRRRLLNDSSPSVRIAALELLMSMKKEPGEFYNDVLTSVGDSDLAVIMAAVESLSRYEEDRGRRRISEDLARLVTTGQIPSALVPTFLAAQLEIYNSTLLVESEAGRVLLKQLQQAPSLGIRINASRLRKSLETRGVVSPVSDRSALIALYREGLVSAQPLEQLDAIAGLSMLEIPDDTPQQSLALKQDLADLLEPSLRSPLQPVRWAAAVVSGEFDPNRVATVTLLSEMLGSLQEDELRGRVESILMSSSSAYAKLILTKMTQKESRELYYVDNDYEYLGFDIPVEKQLLIADALARPTHRRMRMIREILPGTGGYSSAKTQATVSSLLDILKSGDPDQRFAAAYVLGKMGRLPVNSITSTLKAKIITVLASLVEDPHEDIEVRRISATMLGSQGQNIKSFFVENRLPMPYSTCSNFPNFQNSYTVGFRFDEFEGRCLYNSQSTLPVRGQGGMSEIYSKIRQLLGNQTKN